jgi:hypothetical protein
VLTRISAPNFDTVAIAKFSCRHPAWDSGSKPS